MQQAEQLALDSKSVCEDHKLTESFETLWTGFVRGLPVIKDLEEGEAPAVWFLPAY